MSKISPNSQNINILSLLKPYTLVKNWGQNKLYQPINAMEESCINLKYSRLTLLNKDLDTG